MTIFITIHNTFAIRNFFRSGALSVLLNERDARVVALVPEEKLSYYQKEFKDVIFERLPVEVRNSWIERFFYFLTVDAIHTNSVKIQQYSQTFRFGSYASMVWKPLLFPLRRLVWHLGGFSWWRSFVQWLYARIPSNLYAELFQRYKPDLVFAANLINPEDYRILLEAKRDGIKTIGMILSWDNLTTKSSLHVFPDRLITHNPVIKEEARKFAGYPTERAVITGIPQYDRYFQKKGIIGRDKFIKSIGGDPRKKLILYAASGKASIAFDLDIVEMIHKGIKSGALPRDAQILVRPYPRYDFPQEKRAVVEKLPGVIIRSPVEHLGTGRDDWEFEEESLDFMVNSLFHADAVLAMSSTFLIESCIFDKPTISVLFDGYQKKGYYQSAKKLFDFEHLADIKKINAFAFVFNEKELYGAINEALSRPEKRREERKILVSRQCAFTDGRSAERIGRAILELARS